MKSRRASAFCAVISLLMLIASVTMGEGDVPRVRRSDDVNFESLKTVVEQQAAVIQTLTAQVTSQQAEVTALENNLQAQLTSQQAKVTALENKLQAQVTSQHREVTSLNNSLRTVNSNCQAKVTSLENNLHVVQTKVDVASKAVAFFVRLSFDQDDVYDGVAMGPHQTLIFNQAVTNVGKAYNTHTGIFSAPVAGTYAFFLSVMGTRNHTLVELAIMKNGVTLDLVFAKGSEDRRDQGSSLVSTQLVTGDQVWVRQHAGEAVRASYWTVFTGYLLQAQ